MFKIELISTPKWITQSVIPQVCKMWTNEVKYRVIKLNIKYSGHGEVTKAVNFIYKYLFSSNHDSSAYKFSSKL